MEEKKKRKKGIFWLTVATFIVNKKKSFSGFVCHCVYLLCSMHE